MFLLILKAKLRKNLFSLTKNFTFIQNNYFESLFSKQYFIVNKNAILTNV